MDKNPSAGEAVLAEFAEREQHGVEPPDTIAAAMARADVLLVPTVQSLSHTAARKAATDGGARAATLPGVTEEMLARVMSADMAELRRRGWAVAEILNAGSEARITCANGSDLTLNIEGREAIPDNGELQEPGAFGNLPCGEGFISPHHDAGGGTLVTGSLRRFDHLRRAILATELLEGGDADVDRIPQGARLRPRLGHPDHVRRDVPVDVLRARVPNPREFAVLRPDHGFDYGDLAVPRVRNLQKFRLDAPQAPAVRLLQQSRIQHEPLALALDHVLFAHRYTSSDDSTLIPLSSLK